MIVRLDKLKAVLANFVESLPLILISRKKLEDLREELGDAHSEVTCLHKAMLDQQEHFNKLLGEKEDFFNELLDEKEITFESDFLYKHTLKSPKEAWLRRRIYDIKDESAYDTSAASWLPAWVEGLVLNKNNIELLTRADVEWVEKVLDECLPRYLFEVFENKPTSMSKHSH